METKEYRLHADRCFARVSRAFDDVDPDEVEAIGGDGVVTLAFGDGAKFIISRQSATHQVWFAAGARAWHYNYKPEGDTWVDDRDGHDFYKNASALVSAKLGREICL